MKRLAADQIKQIEYEILIEFDRICKDNGLTYCLAYGTALGAERHNGFIPWMMISMYTCLEKITSASLICFLKD